MTYGLRLQIDEFLNLAQQYPVLDVRSPGEYGHAHIPGAYNLPLFSDEERKVVGTAYKQQGREEAIKIGLDYFGVKMRKMVEEAEQIVQNHKAGNNPNLSSDRRASSDVILSLPKNQHPASSIQHPGSSQKAVLLHCWRGGMRSAGVAWLLDLYGFKVYTLAGGYKAFRNWVLRQFEKPWPFKVIGGYTGSGKTIVLKELAKAGHPIIDLEGIAHHKGSAFGDLGEPKQPTPEMFENELGIALDAVRDKEAIWIEDESRRVGDINMPLEFWKAMRTSPVYFLEVPFEERLKYITAEYGKFKNENLVSAVMRIRKRLGGLSAKNTINYLIEENYTEAFRILLGYYDKYYAHGLHDREHLEALLTKIPCTNTDAKTNCKKILSCTEPVAHKTI
jgi:tRNA 2-selenouridine synthase